MKIINTTPFPVLATIELAGLPCQPIELIGVMEFPDLPIVYFRTHSPSAVAVVDWRGIRNPLNIQGRDRLSYEGIEFCAELIVTPLYPPPRIMGDQIAFDPQCGRYKSTGVYYN